MRVGRLAAVSGEPFYALLEAGNLARPYSAAPWLGGQLHDERISWVDERLMAPVTPSKIVCVGRNYAAHARELGHDVPAEPLLFLKPPSAVIGHGGEIVLPPDSSRVEHEAELGVVIAQRTRGVTPEQAPAAIFGFTCVGDITARDLQRKDVQFTRGKGFDTFCPVGPWIETELDATSTTVRCSVNGQKRQEGSTQQMIFPVATLISYVSRVMTLEPGDLLVTGTPEGVGPLVNGDLLDITIDGVGTLSCRVRG